MLQNMEASKLLLNTKIFWAIVVCLYSDCVTHYSEVLSLLSTLVDRLDFGSEAAQNAYKASVPLLGS